MLRPRTLRSTGPEARMRLQIFLEKAQLGQATRRGESKPSAARLILESPVFCGAFEFDVFLTSEGPAKPWDTSRVGGRGYRTLKACLIALTRQFAVEFAEMACRGERCRARHRRDVDDPGTARRRQPQDLRPTDADIPPKPDRRDLARRVLPGIDAGPPCHRSSACRRRRFHAGGPRAHHPIGGEPPSAPTLREGPRARFLL